MSTTEHHDAHGHDHRREEETFDQEVSRRGVTWTLVGILGITVVAMVGMWYLSAFFVSLGASADRVLTPVELERRQAILETDDSLQGTRFEGYDDLVRAMGGVVPPDIVNTWPDDVQPPPYPRVQYAPMNDWLVMKHGFTQQLETYGWDDESAGLVRVPVDVAMRQVLEQGNLTTRSTEFGALGGTSPTTSGVTPEPEGRAEESGAAQSDETRETGETGEQGSEESTEEDPGAGGEGS